MVERKRSETESREKKIRVPSIGVELPVASVRKSFLLKEPLARDLAAYAAFLSEHHGKAIPEEKVVDGLLAELARDKSFAAWRAAKGAL